MQPLAVVHGFDKGSDGGSGLAQIATAASIDLLLLQSLDEAFGLGVVVRIADAGSCWAGSCAARISVYSAQAYWTPRSE
jgi:hypothetical protein